jgi:hypothetical protein
LLTPVAAAAIDAVGKPAAGLDLGGMTSRALGGLADFVVGAADVGAAATTAGAATFAGVLFVPSTGPTGKWVKVPGPGDVSYFHNPDELGITFRYTTPDGVKHEWKAGLKDGPGGAGYRGPDGRIIARWVKTGAKVGLVVSTAALLDDNDGGLCPMPVKDRGGKRGQEYETFMKARFNPGNPTPPGMAYAFLDPKTGAAPRIDDCQQKTGALAEYKGPGYENLLLSNAKVWQSTLTKMLDQAESQDRARGDRPLIWFVDEKAVARELRREFDLRELDIFVVWLPMPRDAK